ncbi:thermonuclease family protein [Methylobacterium isbiliense]|nr:thermonuclease family protein [Methylobacterium isbiliense]MDN3625581.1 thermonuclease family protein [Methylobacterium isbiliense]
MLAAIVLSPLSIGSVLAAEPIVGRASVTDGDTLVIRGNRIRLHGIDAPESAQLCQDAAGKDYRCGQRAALALSDKIGQATVSCEPKDQDRYGRIVAVCSAGGVDLNGWMAEQGHALAYRQYSAAYVGQEEAARAAKRGIWAGAFTPPWDWRRGQRESGSAPAATAPTARPSAPGASGAPATAGAECQIKGNISRSGEKIYHVPGSRDYERTVISTSSGERMFCTEDEAKAAGWRAPGGEAHRGALDADAVWVVRSVSRVQWKL